MRCFDQIRVTLLISLGLTLPSLLPGQSTSLTLSSASGLPGSTIPLNLTLGNTATGGQPASLQFTLSFNPSDFSSVIASTGGVASGAGKSVSCNVVAAGQT